MANDTDVKLSTKDEIAHAALNLFVHKGYHNTSIPDIVAESGHSTGAVYHHFESKENLAKYIHKLASDLFSEKYEKHVRVQTSFKAKLHSFVHMMLSWDDDDPVMVKYLITDRPVEILNRKNTVCSEDGMRLVGEMISQGLVDQEISIENYFMAVSMISGTIIHYINMKKDGYVTGLLGDKSADLSQHIYKSLSK
jgi:AcrR family transcriptional regulator